MSSAPRAYEAYRDFVLVRDLCHFCFMDQHFLAATTGGPRGVEIPEITPLSFHEIPKPPERLKTPRDIEQGIFSLSQETYDD